jgi:hypothetical protein
MKLKRSEITEAVNAYARKHGYYVRTVRDVSAGRYAAIADWKAAPQKSSG